MKKSIVFAPLLVQALVACGDGKKGPPPAPPPATVFVAPVVRRDLPLYIEAVGSMDGYVNAEIRARVRGFLEGQDYKDGARVKANQLLFTIEAAEYETALRSAQANLARARVGQSKNKVDIERDKGLFKSGLVSQQDLDNATAALADADAQVRVAESQVQQAQLNLSYTQIRSPLDGVAGVALVRVGNLVGQDGPTLLTTVSQVDPMRVNFPLSEVDYVKYPERFAHLEGHDLDWSRAQFSRLDNAPGGGQPGDDPGIEILLADGSVYQHRGVIVAAGRQIDASTGTTQLQALVPNPDGFLRPGQYARVRIRRENEGKNVVVVPEKALISVQGSYSVAVVGADNKVQLRRVDLGPAAQGVRVVLKGLEGGESVVVDGVQRVSDGATVNPRPASEAPGSAPASAPASLPTARGN